MTARVDVAVVGAGLAGLVAADRLRMAGASILLIEATEEPGGRTRSGSVGGEPAEFGGEWLGRRHGHLLGLLRHLGIESRPARQLTRPILWRGAERTRLGVPDLSAGQAVALARLLRIASRRARALDPDAPWRSPAAPALDRMSFGHWARSLGVEGDAYRFLDAIIGALSSTPIDELSRLHVLWWICRGEGLAPILWTTFERHVPAGMQSVARALANRLGGALVLGERVTSIVQRDGVEVVCASGRAVRASRAVLAIPATSLRTIAFDPPLPVECTALADLRIDAGTKVVACVPPGHSTRHRFFVGGERLAGGWRVGRRITGFTPPPNSEAPADELIADLAGGFQVDPEALLDPTVFRWSEHPAASGCDVGFAPGQLTALGPSLRRRHGRVHFAGAERSSWPNNMEGAVESGKRASDEVLAASRAFASPASSQAQR